MARFRIERVSATAMMFKFGESKGIRIVLDASAGGALTGMLTSANEVAAAIDGLISELRAPGEQVKGQLSRPTHP